MPPPIIGSRSRDGWTPPKGRIGLIRFQDRHERAHGYVAFALRIHRWSQLQLLIRDEGQPILIIAAIQRSGQTQLMEVGQAGGLSGACLGFGQRRQKHACQDGNDGDHHQQFNERETFDSHRGGLINRSARFKAITDRVTFI